MNKKDRTKFSYTYFKYDGTMLEKLFLWDLCKVVLATPVHRRLFFTVIDFQTTHLVGRRHHKKLKEWGAELFTTSPPVTQQEIESLDDSQFEEIEDD